MDGAVFVHCWLLAWVVFSKFIYVDGGKLEEYCFHLCLFMLCCICIIFLTFTGPSEATLSLSWFTHEPKTLVTGMNHKFLRIYDLRGKCIFSMYRNYFISNIWKYSLYDPLLLFCGHLTCTNLLLSITLWAPNFSDTWQLAEWRSGSVSALPCERPGFASRARLREIIPANNCTMQEQNNWGNWGSPGVMKLWVAWEVLRWLMKFRELCSGGFRPKLVTPPYHGFLNVNSPPNSQNSKTALSATQYASPGRKSPSGSIIIGSMPLLIMRSPPT